jgi:hypothetical protein
MPYELSRASADQAKGKALIGPCSVERATLPMAKKE